jgi:hypothetical protein
MSAVARAELPPVAVYVASFNTAQNTELCVRSLHGFADYPFSLTVGDSGSVDGSAEMLLALQHAGWLRFEQAPRKRTHAEWLDDWLSRCEIRRAAFIDSDIEFRREGWLSPLVTAAEKDAALVCTEMLDEVEWAVEPVERRVVRLAARPAPWLLLIDVPRIRELGVGFSFQAAKTKAVREGLIAYDVGGLLFRELRARELPWTEMPPTYRACFRHYGGMSWRAGEEQASLRRRWQRLMIAARLWRLRRVRTPSRWYTPYA